ncbi:hypothetical protein E1263_05545 [Kribbella antibiotica]|uniref:Uncharacterized protein n=1 Tax=Kribbella antibiotica TaxID=190195 RepID=A0A4R4ZUM4_9ACTN|nr:hypothetical protein [Kribbella antibiotica]TDD62076.1 hypothetical protein E1263_05545 [Kribbella antibiotica]
MATAVEVEHEWEYSYKDWEALKKAVDAGGGVLRVVMWELRHLEDAGRLGVHVRASISRNLLGLGLAHLPKELPSYQEQEAVIYKLGTPAAAVVDAVAGESNKEAEAALRRLNTSRDSEKLQAVTEKFAELSEILEG